MVLVMDKELKNELRIRSSAPVAILDQIRLEDARMDEMYHYAIQGGRRLRASLVSLGNDAVGASLDTSSAAAAIELMHKFTLVHDDLIDLEDHRRGRRCFHEVFGSKNAIIMGDFLISLSFNVLSRLRPAFKPKPILSCYNILSETLNSLCVGEVKDCLFEDRTNVTMPQYLQMIEEKTASLMRNGLRMGAVLGDANEKELQLLSDYGRYLGIEFQIQNDINNLLSVEEEAGRKKGFDIYKKKKTPMVIRTMEKGSSREKRTILQIFSKKEYSKTDIDTAIDIFKDNGALKYSVGLVHEYADNARKSLANLEKSEAKDILIHLADYIEKDSYWKSNPH
jgi:geranylgeranyl diphosphate synthase type I